MLYQEGTILSPRTLGYDTLKKVFDATIIIMLYHAKNIHGQKLYEDSPRIYFREKSI